MLPPMQLLYVDDSGNENRILLSAVAVSSEDWKTCLRSWLEWRRVLYVDHQIPTDFELHAAEFVTGRGNPAPSQPDGSEPAINRSKLLRRRLYETSLGTIAGLPVNIFTVHLDARRSSPTRPERSCGTGMTSACRKSCCRSTTTSSDGGSPQRDEPRLSGARRKRDRVLVGTDGPALRRALCA